jgi:hypothetical protein
MLPTSGAASAPIASPVTLPRVHAEPRQFYVRMAYACAFVAIAGFTPDILGAGRNRIVRRSTHPARARPPLFRFSAWMLLFIAQARSRRQVTVGRIGGHTCGLCELRQSGCRLSSSPIA